MRSARHPRKAAAAVAAAAAGLTLLAGCSGEQSAGHARPVSANSTAGHMSAADRNWLAEAHQADMAEVEAGSLAAEKSSNSAVQAAGSMMASDHSQFDSKIVGAAGALHLTLPDYLTLADSQAADRLSTETGSVYDHDFTATMMTSHELAISDTKAEISHGTSPSVTGLARQALPMLQKHLATLQAAASAR